MRGRQTLTAAHLPLLACGVHPTALHNGAPRAGPGGDPTGPACAAGLSATAPCAAARRCAASCAGCHCCVARCAAARCAVAPHCAAVACCAACDPACCSRRSGRGRAASAAVGKGERRARRRFGAPRRSHCRKGAAQRRADGWPHVADDLGFCTSIQQRHVLLHGQGSRKPGARWNCESGSEGRSDPAGHCQAERAAQEGGRQQEA